MTIPIIQIVLSIVLITLILLQERSSGAGGFLGAAGTTQVYQTRRGLERVVFASTVVGCLIFIGLALFQLIR